VSGTALGNHVRRLRFEHGELSQEALAQAVGITRQTVIAIEAGRYAPSLELAMRMAWVFSKPVDALFYWRVPPSLPRFTPDLEKA
jgi:putative transcriptional regulator